MPIRFISTGARGPVSIVEVYVSLVFIVKSTPPLCSFVQKDYIKIILTTHYTSITILKAYLEAICASEPNLFSAM